MAKSVSNSLLAIIIIEAYCRSDCGLASSWIWILPDVRTSFSQAGVPDVRA